LGKLIKTLAKSIFSIPPGKACRSTGSLSYDCRLHYEATHGTQILKCTHLNLPIGPILFRRHFMELGLDGRKLFS
jgi:hypothetical protein